VATFDRQGPEYASFDLSIKVRSVLRARPKYESDVPRNRQAVIPDIEITKVSLELTALFVIDVHVTSFCPPTQALDLLSSIGKQVDASTVARPIPNEGIVPIENGSDKKFPFLG
jgi:hypothetical protein